MAGCVRAQQNWRWYWLTGLCSVFCPLVAAAQLDGAKPSGLLPDPTRPAYTEAISVAAGGSAAVSRLTSIVQRKGARSYAVIDGVVVHIGDTVGDAQLQQIRESSVVLKSADGAETLMLTPGIEKKSKPLQTGKTQAATGSNPKRSAQAQTRDPS